MTAYHSSSVSRSREVRCHCGRTRNGSVSGGVIGGLVFGRRNRISWPARVLRGAATPCSRSPLPRPSLTAPTSRPELFSLAGLFATIAAGIAFRYYEAQIDRRLHSQRSRNVLEPLGADRKHCGVLSRGAAFQAGELTRDPRSFSRRSAAVAGCSRFAVAALLLPAGYPRAWFCGHSTLQGYAVHCAWHSRSRCRRRCSHRQSIIDATFAVVLYTLSLVVLRLRDRSDARHNKRCYVSAIRASESPACA